mgnify:CR=1 FL=1
MPWFLGALVDPHLAQGQGAIYQHWVWCYLYLSGILERMESMSEEYQPEDQDGRSVAGIVLDLVASCDWITPAAQWLNDARGMVSVYGSAGEMKQLQMRGIRCHLPYVDVATGLYLWQITPDDYEKAKRMKLL